MLDWHTLPDDVDLAWADGDLDAALAALVGGDTAPALGLLAATRDDAHRRELVAVVLGQGGRRDLDALRALVRAAPDDPERLLLLGSALAAAAWAARGADVIERTGESAVDAMIRLSREGQDVLRRAAALAPTDAVPWAVLQICLHPVAEGRRDLDAVFAEVERRAPGLFGAVVVRHAILTRKWYGAPGEALAFARERTAGLPDGHPLWALVASGQIEQWIEGQMQGNLLRRIWRSLRNTIDADALPEVTAASDRFLADRTSFAAHPDLLRAHQLFAAFFDVARDTERLRRHLELAGPRPDVWPWGYLDGGTREAFAESRQKAGLVA